MTKKTNEPSVAKHFAIVASLAFASYIYLHNDEEKIESVARDDTISTSV